MTCACADAIVTLPWCLSPRSCLLLNPSPLHYMLHSKHSHVAEEALKKRAIGVWLTCWLSRGSKATIVHARGEVDAFTSASLGQCLRTAMMDRRGEIILDLSGVTFIDASGLRILDRCQQDCRDRKLSFSLTQPAPHIRRLLQLVHLDTSLPVLDSISEGDGDALVDGVSDPR